MKTRFILEEPIPMSEPQYRHFFPIRSGPFRPPRNQPCNSRTSPSSWESASQGSMWWPVVVCTVTSSRRSAPGPQGTF
jgi:hypothetical protein